MVVRLGVGVVMVSVCVFGRIRRGVGPLVLSRQVGPHECRQHR